MGSNPAYDPKQSLTNTQSSGLGQLNQGFAQMLSSNPAFAQALQSLQGAGSSLGGAQSALQNATPYIQNSSGLQGQAIGQMAGDTQQIQGITNSGNSQLQNILSGNNLSPSSNPYLAQTANAANQSLISQYQQAIAPSLMAQGEQAYGGGPGATQGSAYQQANSTAQQNLLQGLSNQDANIYGQNYANAQNQITSALGELPGVQQGNFTGANQLLNAANVGLNTANTQIGQGSALTNAANTQAGIGSQQAGVGAQQAGVGTQMANAGLGAFGAGTTQYGQQENDINQLAGIGAQQQQQQQTGLDTAQQNAAASNQYGLGMLSQYGSLLGQATGGLGSSFSVGTQQK